MYYKLMKRLSEPSTYAGVAPIVLGLGLFGFDDAMWQGIFALLAGAFGVAAMVMKEAGNNR